MSNIVFNIHEEPIRVIVGNGDNIVVTLNQSLISGSASDNSTAIFTTGKLLYNHITGTGTSLQNQIDYLISQTGEFYPKNTNPSGFLTGETDPIYNSERDTIIFQGNNITLLNNNTGFITNSALLIGDVTGTIISNKVIKIQGLSFNTGVPLNNQGYFWNSGNSRFELKTLSSLESDPLFLNASGLFYNKVQSDERYTLKTGASGDITGVHPNLTVIKIRNKTISDIEPNNGQVLIWNTGLNAWIPGDVSSQQAPESDPIYTAAIPNIIFNTTSCGGDLTGFYPNPGLRNGIGLSKFTNDANYIKFSSNASGDITGLFSNIYVAKIKGIPVSGTPLQNQVLSYSGGFWIPVTPFSGGDEIDPIYNFEKSNILFKTFIFSGDITGLWTGLLIKNGVITQPKLANNINISTFINDSQFIKYTDLASGDLTGLYNHVKVSKLQGRQVSNVTPSIGQILEWNGLEWIPNNNPAIGGAAGGDLTGTYPNPTIKNDAINISKFINDTGYLLSSRGGRITIPSGQYSYCFSYPGLTTGAIIIGTPINTPDLTSFCFIPGSGEFCVKIGASFNTDVDFSYYIVSL